MISAKVIKDSIAENGSRLTTLEVVCHRFVLAEFNTHRAFSRNSASSRAIPLKKQIEKVKTNPAIPMVWASERPGMSGGAEVDYKKVAETIWLEAAQEAVEKAQALADFDVHKSICNRLLEPFMWHTVIVSATDWDGFWKQRCSPLAQPEMRLCAEAMKEAFDASIPEKLELGEWHLPYIDYQDRIEADTAQRHDPGISGIEVLKQVSAARCARVSYLTHDGVRSMDKDQDLYDKLATADPPHASPLEHVATPNTHGATSDLSIYNSPGNFTGWRQLRHEVFPGY